MAKILVNNSGPLHGEVWISGAKNSVLPLMAATILTADTCVIEDVPDLADVSVMKKMLSKYGAQIDDAEEGTIRISTPEIVSCEGDRDLVQEMRASLFTMGPMLARYGKIVMPMPGGCTIGRRPIDLHLKGFRALGAEVVEDDENNTIPILERYGDFVAKYTRILNDNGAEFCTEACGDYLNLHEGELKVRDTYPYLYAEFSSPLFTEDLQIMVGWEIDYDNYWVIDYNRQQYLENQFFADTKRSLMNVPPFVFYFCG